MFLFLCIIQDNLHREVEDLNSTDDRETREQTESATNPSYHIRELDPAILGDPVEYDAFEVDSDKLKVAPVFSEVCITVYWGVGF